MAMVWWLMAAAISMVGNAAVAVLVVSPKKGKKPDKQVSGPGFSLIGV